MRETLNEKAKSPEKKQRFNNRNDDDGNKSTQSELEKRAKYVRETRERTNKSVSARKSPKANIGKSFLTSKQALMIEALAGNKNLDEKIEESVKEISHLKKRSISPQRPHNLEDLGILLEDIDKSLNHCDKLQSQELLIESQLKQNYWNVGTLVKKTFGNFINYVKHYEKEMMKKLKGKKIR